MESIHSMLSEIRSSVARIEKSGDEGEIEKTRGLLRDFTAAVLAMPEPPEATINKIDLQMPAPLEADFAAFRRALYERGQRVC